MESVTKRVLAFLQKYHTLSTYEMIEQFNIMRPAVVIHELRKQGNNIRTEQMKTRRKDTGRTVYYARYWLEK